MIEVLEARSDGLRESIKGYVNEGDLQSAYRLVRSYEDYQRGIDALEHVLKVESLRIQIERFCPCPNSKINCLYPNCQRKVLEERLFTRL